MKRIAVLASGKGSNLQVIIEACERGDIKNAQVVVVISDKKDAYALTRARNKGILAIHLSSKGYRFREDYDRKIVEILKEHEVDLVVLAGFMRVLSPFFVREFRNKILNIHPALLPSFPGAHGVRDALNYGVKVTGCTVHFVDEGMDTGPIVLQEAVKVVDTDTEETLHSSIQEIEHKLYPKAIDLVLQGKVKIEGRRCIVDEK